MELVGPACPERWSVTQSTVWTAMTSFVVALTPSAFVFGDG